MSRRATGCMPVKPFQHKPKVRRNARPKLELQANQRLKMSPWDQIENIKMRVDRYEVGIAYSQPYDPTPKLNRTGYRGNR